MLHAVAQDFARVPGIHVVTLVDDRCPQPPGHECRRIGRGSGDAEAFNSCARETDAALLIAPEFMDALYDRSRWVLEAGGRLLGSLPQAVQLAGDKQMMQRRWQALGVLTPATLPAGPELPTEFAPPWVCKPRY